MEPGRESEAIGQAVGGSSGRKGDATGLAKAFGWFERIGNQSTIVWGLAAVCVLLVVLELSFVEHKAEGIKAIVGIYAIAGLVMLSAIVVLARGVRAMLGRPEDHYGERGFDDEDHPTDQLGVAERDG